MAVRVLKIRAGGGDEARAHGLEPEPSAAAAIALREPTAVHHRLARRAAPHGDGAGARHQRGAVTVELGEDEIHVARHDHVLRAQAVAQPLRDRLGATLVDAGQADARPGARGQLPERVDQALHARQKLGRVGAHEA